MDVYTENQDRGKRFDSEFEAFLEDVSEKRANGEIGDIEIREIAEADKAMLERGEAFEEIFKQRLVDEYSIRGYAEVTMVDQIGKKELQRLKPVWDVEVSKVKHYILNFPDWSRPLLFDFLFERVDLLANLNFDGFSHILTRLEKAFKVFSTSKRERMTLDALGTVKTYTELLQKSLGFNPHEEIKRVREQMISEQMEFDWRSMSRNVRGSSSQIQSMKKRHRDQYEKMWDEGLQNYSQASIIVQRMSCTEIKNNYTGLKAAMGKSKLALGLNEIITSTIAFSAKANESMETLKKPSVGTKCTTKYGEVIVQKIREDGIIVCKLPYGIGYFQEKDLKSESVITISALKLALEFAAVGDLFAKPKSEDASPLKLPKSSPNTLETPTQQQGYSLRDKPSPSQVGPLSISELEPIELKLTRAKPVMIQLLIPNQRPSRQKLNETHTILELYQHVKFLTKATQNFNLILLFSFSWVLPKLSSELKVVRSCKLTSGLVFK